MRNQYKFNKNYKAPDEETIRSFMDFDAVLKESQSQSIEQLGSVKQPGKRNIFFYTSAVAASALLIIFVYMTFFSDSYEEKQAAYFAEQSYINPPELDQAKPSFASYKVSAYDGGIIEHETGSRVTIPKEAFEYKNGEIVSGNVDILYREFHDYIDFFLSGVPMTYDSLGQVYNLESAGMIEIFAEQGGQRLNIRPGKSLEVELISIVQLQDLDFPPSFNIYKLDESERKWLYKDIDNIEFLEVQPEPVNAGHVAYDIQKQYFNRIDELDLLYKDLINKVKQTVYLPSEPVRPTQQNKDALVVNFNLKNQLRTAAPALYGTYKDALWQLHPSEMISKEVLAQKWDELKLVQLNELDFRLTLINQEQTQTVLINPLLIGPAFEKAMDDYGRALDNYGASMEIWEKEIAEKKKAIEENIKDQKFLAQQEYKNALNALRTDTNKKEIDPLIQRTKVVNKFAADELGVWNCDRPVLPEMKSFTAKFKLPDGKVLNNITGYIACKGQNTVGKFLIDRKTPMHIDLKKDYLIWMVLPDNKLAVLKPKQFKEINPKAKRQQFTVSLANETDFDESKLRALLNY
jgi:hypothetical protein